MTADLASSGLLRIPVRLLAVAAIALCSVAAHGLPVPGQGTWETTLQARDINGDAIVDAWYDTALNISWLANWNANGEMPWPTALAWAASLDVYGVTGWRLPRIIDTGPPGCDWHAAGGTDCGYNVDTSTSEMAHMFYVTLGDVAHCPVGDDWCSSPNPYQGFTNTGPFSDMQGWVYWSGTRYVDPDFTWYFDNDLGDQGPTLSNPQITNAAYFAVAVHAGDVGAPPTVPEPSSVVLLLTTAVAAGLCVRHRTPAGAGSNRA